MKRLETSLLASVLALVSTLTLVPPAGATAVPALRPEAHPRIMSAAADLAAQPATSPLSTVAAAAPVPLNLHAAANSGLHREVFGFVNAGNLGNTSVGYPSWNFSLLSTVAYFGLQGVPAEPVPAAA